jgi:hypothetical protein
MLQRRRAVPDGLHNALALGKITRQELDDFGFGWHVGTPVMSW